MYFPIWEKCTAYSYQNPWMMKEDKQALIEKSELVKKTVTENNTHCKKEMLTRVFINNPIHSSVIP